MKIAQELELPDDAVTQTFAQIGRKGSGKALALDTPLATPDGWTTMGDIKVGEELFDEDGNICKVTYVAPIRKGNDCYKLVFSDKTSIVADAEHLWITEDYSSRKADAGQKAKPRRGGRGGQGMQPQCQRKNFPKLVTTEIISKTLMAASGTARNHAIKNAKPIKCPKAELLIDPYVLGVWLGDGTSACGCITTADKEIVKYISKVYEIWEVKSQRQSGCRTYRIGKLNQKLRKLNLLGNKHIPELYLRSSFNQRLSLLKGLMDSDGTFCNKGNSCEFTNCNVSIANGTEEIIVSLGWRVSRRTKQPKIKGNEEAKCKLSHQLSFRPSESVFKLKRKSSKMNFNVSQSQRHLRRYIISAEKVDSVPVRCIAVDSKNHLFLAGSQMIPTHNTYLASMIAEQMLDTKAQVIVIDPIGNWWGLRLDADGKSKGKDIFIMGGSKGDVPLAPESGREIAKILIETNISVVLDISEFRKNARKTFVTDFAEEFYHLKKSSPSPTHIFLEESQKFCPQRVQRDEARMLGAWEDIVRLGRNHGIGCSLISQRPQSINKEVLSQVECLCVLQVTGLHERKALEEWIQEAGSDRKIVGTLPSLGQGEGYVWSPSWLKIFKRVKFNKKTTFDTSATPKMGKATRATEISKMDVAKLQKLMVTVVDKVKKEKLDKKILIDEIHVLKKQVRGLEHSKPTPKIDERSIERARDQGLREGIKEGEKQFKVLQKDYTNCQRKVTEIARIIGKQVEIKRVAWKDLPKRKPTEKEREIIKKPVEIPNQSSRFEDRMDLGLCARKIYSFLYNFQERTFSKQQIGAMTGYSSKSGGFNNAISQLSSQGLIERTNGLISVKHTDPGIAEHFDYSIRSIISKLQKCPATIYQLLLENPYEEYSKEQLAEETGYASGSGGVNNAISKLNTLGLIKRDNGKIQLNPEIQDLG